MGALDGTGLRGVVSPGGIGAVSITGAVVGGGGGTKRLRRGEYMSL